MEKYRDLIIHNYLHVWLGSRIELKEEGVGLDEKWLRDWVF